MSVRRKADIKIRYGYMKTIASKVLNYGKSLREIGTVSYDDLLGMECCWDGYIFRDSYHGHIVTGDLQIVRNEKLRALLGHGTKFREVPLLDKESIVGDLRKGLDNLVRGYVTKFDITRRDMKNWRDGVFRVVRRKLDHLVGSVQYDKPVLGDISCRAELDRFCYYCGR